MNRNVTVCVLSGHGSESCLITDTAPRWEQFVGGHSTSSLWCRRQPSWHDVRQRSACYQQRWRNGCREHPQWNDREQAALWILWLLQYHAKRLAVKEERAWKHQFCVKWDAKPCNFNFLTVVNCRSISSYRPIVPTDIVFLPLCACLWFPGSVLYLIIMFRETCGKEMQSMGQFSAFYEIMGKWRKEQVD